ncbi:PIN-like domain-containing protein [Pseudomonas yamanorum]|uniref:PIN like domain-containing protein n=1 Tax=Pseudomonas yamanorum TaxID=515393 RepID=A0A7Y8EE17_9PSED|nr:PIN-like domain-containing protein [Pseudomonas yamanorum]NWE12837.1 hypothetical protein [Pseudomonas yamanorum]
MKTKFHEYFMLGDADYKVLWEDSILVFDANILLNLYRYSDATKTEFISVIKELKEKLWLPHRAVEEYLANRLDVLDSQDKKYELSINGIIAMKKELEQTRHHPFVSEEVMIKAMEAFGLLTDELNRNKEIFARRIYLDDVKDALGELLDGRVGDSFGEEELRRIISEGEVRYANKIPPGYKDAKKKVESDFLPDICRPYGDLILWKQILLKAATEQKPIIYVTDDRKEDWWYEHKGKTIGPRPELVSEFKSVTGFNMVMFSPENFLKEAKVYLKRDISAEAVQEVSEISKEDSALALSATADLVEVQHQVAESYARLNQIAFELQTLQKYKETMDFEIEEAEQRLVVLKLELEDMAVSPINKLKIRIRNKPIIDAQTSLIFSRKSERSDIEHKISNLNLLKSGLEIKINAIQAYGY